MIGTRSDIIVKLIRNGRTSWAKKQRAKLQTQTRGMSAMVCQTHQNMFSVDQLLQMSPLQPNLAHISLENVLALHVDSLISAGATQGITANFVFLFLIVGLNLCQFLLFIITAMVKRNAALMLFTGNALDDGT